MMENDLISVYKKAYISEIPDIWGKIKTGIDSKSTLSSKETSKLKPNTKLTIGAKYPWMVLMAATIIVMIFIVPMFMFLIRHQTDYVLAAPYAAEENPNNSLLTVQIVDDSFVLDSVSADQINSGNVIFTHKQLTAITQTAFSGVFGGVCLAVISICMIRLHRRDKSMLVK